jgi:predicted GNAT superfamily acetyltransferase
MTNPRGLPNTVLIRDIKSIAEMREVEALQKEVWGVDDLDIFPAIGLRPLIEIGAVLIGAFEGAQLVGFVFGFPGLVNGKPIIHSDMLAVKASHRSLGLGYLLKLAQREAALKLGVNEITWTFDPLQSRNAHLNFGKLGVICDRYEVNFYGETSSFLHSTGTDRLWVTWLLASDRVVQRTEQYVFSELDHIQLSRFPRLIRVGPNGQPLNEEVQDGVPALAIEIPAELRAETALKWRGATRSAFAGSIARGYFVEDFYVSESDAGKVGCYLLKKKSHSQ